MNDNATVNDVFNKLVELEQRIEKLEQNTQWTIPPVVGVIDNFNSELDKAYPSKVNTHKNK